MGCADSRPDLSQENDHVSKQVHQNDEEFQYPPSIPTISEYSNKPIITADDQTQCFNQISSIKKEMQGVEDLISSLKSKKPTNSSRLTIEVQKGREIFPNTSCIQKPRPFVQVELIPGKITYRTSEAKPFIPAWHQVFVHKAGIQGVEKLLVTVKFKTEFGDDVKLGSAEVNLRELGKMTVFDEWVVLKCKEGNEGKPAIKIRVQAIEDEAKFRVESISKGEELLAMAQEVRDKLERKVKDCEEAIGPEGRG